MKNEIKEWIIDLIGVACAAAVFAALFMAFLYAVRCADADMPGRAEVSAEVFGAGAPVEEAEFAEDIDVPSIEIYREGDGPAPAWYDPSEPMAAEWSAIVHESEKDARYASDYIFNVPLTDEFQAYLYGLCTEAGIPFALAVAVIEAESSYQPDVISPTGDWGLMQINWRCHEWLERELGVTDWLDPYQNARAGVWILGQYYAEYGADSGTLMAYNMGQASAEALFAAGVYETDYSRRVIGIRWRLEAEGR